MFLHVSKFYIYIFSNFLSYFENLQGVYVLPLLQALYSVAYF